MSNDQLTQIQQTFVRRFMGDERILGVRVRRDDGIPVLVVELDPDAGASPELPAEFDGVRVECQPGRKAILAYAL